MKNLMIYIYVKILQIHRTYSSSYSATVFSKSCMLAELFSIVFRFIFTLIESMQTLSKTYETHFSLFLLQITTWESDIERNFDFSYQCYEPRQRQLPNSCSVLWRQFLQSLDLVNNDNCTPRFVRAKSKNKYRLSILHISIYKIRHESY